MEQDILESAERSDVISTEDIKRIFIHWCTKLDKWFKPN